MHKLQFTPITLSLKEKVEAIRKKCGNTLYLNTFASLFSWSEDEQYEICITEGAFIVKNGVEGENAYMFPVGNESAKLKLIDALMEYEKPVFVSVTDEDKALLEKAYPDIFSFEECRNEFIYLYDKDEQLELRGKKFKSVRHNINSGRSFANEWSVIPLSDNNIKRALKINEKWATVKGDYTLADINAANTALKNFTELSMFGIILQADGKDAAYVAGSFITPEKFDLAFCKVLAKGCDFFTRWTFFSALPEETKIIDSEEDLGIEGLRDNKLSRRPKELIRIWKGSINI